LKMSNFESDSDEEIEVNSLIDTFRILSKNAKGWKQVLKLSNIRMVLGPILKNFFTAAVFLPYCNMLKMLPLATSVTSTQVADKAGSQPLELRDTILVSFSYACFY
jgi:hypothetical protein